MKTLRETLKQLSKAVEFVNIERIDELDELLESRKASSATKDRETAIGGGQTRNFGRFATPAAPNLFLIR
jgi:hypothetical protein